MLEHDGFIKSLGGPTVVAKQLSELTGENLDREAVYKWNKNGVPWRWRAHLLAIAGKRGVKAPKDFLPGMPA